MSVWIFFNCYNNLWVYKNKILVNKILVKNVIVLVKNVIELILEKFSKYDLEY